MLNVFITLGDFPLIVHLYDAENLSVVIKVLRKSKRQLNIITNLCSYLKILSVQLILNLGSKQNLFYQIVTLNNYYEVNMFFLYYTQ